MRHCWWRVVMYLVQQIPVPYAQSSRPALGASEFEKMRPASRRCEMYRRTQGTWECMYKISKGVSIQAVDSSLWWTAHQTAWRMRYLSRWVPYVCMYLLPWRIGDDRNQRAAGGSFSVCYLPPTYLKVM